MKKKQIKHSAALSLRHPFIILCLMALMIQSCRKDEAIEPGTGEQTAQPRAVTTPKVVITPANDSERMFEDGEATSTLLSTSRRFSVARLLRVKAINNTTIEVANFAPIDITDAVILINIAGRTKPVKLLLCDIKAHAIKQIQYPFIAGQTDYYEWQTDVIVSLSQYKPNGISPANVSFDYNGSTALIQKLKKAGEMKWDYQPYDFDPNNDPNNNWKDTPTGKDYRLIISHIVNMAYLYSSATTMRSAYLNEPITDNFKVFMTTAQKETAFNNIINKGFMNLGVCANVQGLGGGDTFALGPWVADGAIYKPSSTFPHEMAHVVGFNHDSSMTYPQNGKGAVPASNRVWQSHIDNGSLPVKSTNYYKPGDLSAP